MEIKKYIIRSLNLKLLEKWRNTFPVDFYPDNFVVDIFQENKLNVMHIICLVFAWLSIKIQHNCSDVHYTLIKGQSQDQGLAFCLDTAWLTIYVFWRLNVHKANGKWEMGRFCLTLFCPTTYHICIQVAVLLSNLCQTKVLNEFFLEYQVSSITAVNRSSKNWETF